MIEFTTNLTSLGGKYYDQMLTMTITPNQSDKIDHGIVLS
jgi:hypothetical protein